MIIREEEKEFLIQNAKLRTTKELADIFNKKFNRNISVNNMNNIKHYYGIHSGLKKQYSNRHKWTEEEKIFLRENSEGINQYQLYDLFVKKFNSNLTFYQVIGIKKYLKIKSGVRNTKFTIGNNLNYLPIGSERKRKKYDGKYYCYIKVADPSEWKPKQNVIYEKEKGIKIQKYQSVIFLDGNIENFDINNLELVTSKEHMSLVGNNLKTDNPELTKAAIYNIRLTNKIKDMEE